MGRCLRPTHACARRIAALNTETSTSGQDTGCSSDPRWSLLDLSGHVSRPEGVSWVFVQRASTDNGPERLSLASMAAVQLCPRVQSSAGPAADLIRQVFHRLFLHKDLSLGSGGLGLVLWRQNFQGFERSIPTLSPPIRAFFRG